MSQAWCKSWPRGERAKESWQHEWIEARCSPKALSHGPSGRLHTSRLAAAAAALTKATAYAACDFLGLFGCWEFEQQHAKEEEKKQQTPAEARLFFYTLVFSGLSPSTSYCIHCIIIITIMANPNAGHFFQTSESLVAEQRKASKAQNKLGRPIKLSSKLLAVTADPFDERAVYVAEAAGEVRRVVLEVSFWQSFLFSPSCHEIRWPVLRDLLEDFMGKITTTH
jgi:hypothetical protein